MKVENKPKTFAIFLCLLPIAFTSLAFTVYQDAVVPPNATSAEVYQLRCAACHDKTTARIPPRAQIVKRTTEKVVQTMTTGTMKQWAEGLTPAQITSVAVYLTGKPLAPVCAFLWLTFSARFVCSRCYSLDKLLPDRERRQ